MTLKSFEIKKRADGFWVPADPAVENLARFLQDDVSTLTQIRYYLYAAVAAAAPDVYTLDWPLVSLRTNAFMRIDQRSDELIAMGFKFQDIIFSLTNEAQIRYATMMMVADHFTYPLGINSLDDEHIVQLLSPDHTRMFCMTALGYVKSVVDSGTVEKDRVRAMTDPDVLAQFSDSRQFTGAMPQPSEPPSAPEPPPEPEEPTP